MSESLRNNPIALRSCILYDFLRKKSAKESFDKLCSVVGRDAILWEEFNFWLDRFENGNFDLEFATETVAKIHLETKLEELKISAEPKILEFSDLNTDVLKAIIEKTELKERLILRKVSRGLRDLVDEQKSAWTEIRFDCRVDHICANFNSNNVVYGDPKFDFSKFEKEYRYKDAKVIKSEKYVKMALDELQFAVKDPSVEIRTLEVEFIRGNRKTSIVHLDQFSQEIETILKSLNRKIHVKFFTVRAESANHVLAILPYLEPGTLSMVMLDQEGSQWRGSEAEIDQIAELDQWKQAKWLYSRCAEAMWPEKHLMHFAGFTIFEDRMSAQAVRKWINLFSKSKNFECCQMNTYDSFYPKQIQNYIVDGDPPANHNTFFLNPTYVIEHPIRDDSTKYLEITVRPLMDCIVFKKMARQSL